MSTIARKVKYRGRIAPTPSGLMHLGHAKTFWVAQERARRYGGELILRVDDLDHVRCRNPQWLLGIVEDLHWFGLRWDFGPFSEHGLDGLTDAYYRQSQRAPLYMNAWRMLLDRGRIYGSRQSRRDVERAMGAPHAEDDAEPIFPPELRPSAEQRLKDSSVISPLGINWRFMVEDGTTVRFTDEYFGEQSFVAGKDFGDFVVYRSDGICAYELAVVIDDADMVVTEVVRGADLLLSTARQLLLYEALGLSAPSFFHCPLVLDADGRRLAKRDSSKSLRSFREEGLTPEEIRGNLLHFTEKELVS